MNCDEAFDRMTDPLRNRSAELQWHLDLCPRCRQMRDVLAPALDLLMPEDDGTGDATTFAAYETPMQSGREPFLSPETLAVAERAAETFARRNASPVVRPSPRRGWWKYAVIVSIALVMTFGGIFLAGIERDRAQAVAGSDNCLLMQRPVPVESFRKSGAGHVIQQCQVCHADAARKNKEID